MVVAVAGAPISSLGEYSFRTRNPDTGHALAGLINVKDPSSCRICVIAHGLLSSKEAGIIRQLGTQVDYNTCRFDFSGNGESEGPFRYAGYEVELRDLRAVVQGLREEGWEIACILGHSKGAHCVLRYASVYGDVPKVYSLSARYDFTKQPKSRFTAEQRKAMDEERFFLWNVKGTDYKVTKEDFYERDKVDMAALVDGIRTSPHKPFVLLSHGELDETMPVTEAPAIAARLDPSHCRVVTFKGADHFFRTPEMAKEVVDTVTAFLKEDIPAS